MHITKIKNILHMVMHNEEWASSYKTRQRSHELFIDMFFFHGSAKAWQ